MEFIDDNIWKPIHTLPGYECCIEYYINDAGQVKSTKGVIERILKQRVNKNGYSQVNLTQRIGRKRTVTVTVHKLVALAFLDQPLANPGKTKGCSRVKHIDGNKIKSKTARGVGLRNIDDRLKVLYGDDYVFNINAKSSGGLKTTIKLPLESQDEADIVNPAYNSMKVS